MLQWFHNIYISNAILHEIKHVGSISFLDMIWSHIVTIVEKGFTRDDWFTHFDVTRYYVSCLSKWIHAEVFI